MLTDLADPDLLRVLEGDHTPSYVASVTYGDELVIPALPIAESQGSLTFDEDGQVQASGSIYAASDVSGQSIAPLALTDPLAPYGQEVTLARRIKSGDQEWDIPLGVYGIDRVPGIREYRQRFGATLSAAVKLSLKDRFEPIRKGDFLTPTAPSFLASTWDEIASLCPFPVERTLADGVLPAALAYGDSRYDAIRTLLDNLGGMPAFTRSGALTGRVKDPWLTETETVFEITGTVTVDRTLDADDVYNAVRVRASIGENTILGIAQILADDHPLRVGGPFNAGLPRVYGYGSPLITSQGMADATAETILARVSTQHAERITVECVPNPLLELGDFGIVHDAWSKLVYTGSIARIVFSMDPYAPMTLEITVATVEEAS